MKSLDKTSPIPLHYQLYSMILADIRSGVLKSGDMIPAEMEMMKIYDVSRATVRRALGDLAREGYLTRAKSKGTVVSDSSPTVGYKNRVKGFSALINSSNEPIKLTSKVLACSVIDPPAFVQEALKLSPGSKVFYLKRVRSIHGIPNVFVEDWLDYRYIPGIERVDFESNSLYDTLEEKYADLYYKSLFDMFYVKNDSKLRMVLLNGLKFLTSIPWENDFLKDRIDNFESESREHYEKYKNGVVGIIFSAVVFILSVAYLTDATYNPFLYFRF